MVFVFECSVFWLVLVFLVALDKIFSGFPVFFVLAAGKIMVRKKLNFEHLVVCFGCLFSCAFLAIVQSYFIWFLSCFSYKWNQALLGSCYNLSRDEVFLFLFLGNTWFLKKITHCVSCCFRWNPWSVFAILSLDCLENCGKEKKIESWILWFMLFLFTKNWNAHNTTMFSWMKVLVFFIFIFVSIPCSKSMGSRF